MAIVTLPFGMVVEIVVIPVIGRHSCRSAADAIDLIKATVR